MIARLKRFSRVVANRVIYLPLLLAVMIFAITSGERMLYISAVVLVVLPPISFAITFIMLRALVVKQDIPETVVKAEEGVLRVRLHNRTPLPFTNIECRFITNEYAIETSDSQSSVLNPLETIVQEIPFYAVYRGKYQLGLEEIWVSDFMGLFRLRRKYKIPGEILILPQIVDFSGIPFSFNIMSEASSRFDHRDEDYSIISDIRPYIPTDSIKRVHWKLTAKRSEWLVKVFQSNALNCVSVIVDSLAISAKGEEKYLLEDQIVESALGLARHCLKKAMPVDFIDTGGSKTRAITLQQFDIIYHATAQLQFSKEPPLNPVAILTNMLNDSASYVNAIVFTSKLDVALYERVVNAMDKGHFTAVVYFATKKPIREYERMYQLMVDNGLPCFRMTEEVSLDVA